ncbi:MAG: HEAT repeat domain-containing protein [Gemmataceae bacterium]|nr:HEAT repeat domain-containing protein [Gemmataceae bacterium]
MPCRSPLLLALPVIAALALGAGPPQPADLPGPVEEDALLRSLFRHSAEIDLGGRDAIEDWMKGTAHLVHDIERHNDYGPLPAMAGPVRPLAPAHRTWLLANPGLAGLKLVPEGKEHLHGARYDVLREVSDSSLSPSGGGNNYRSRDFDRVGNLFRDAKRRFGSVFSPATKKALPEHADLTLMAARLLPAAIEQAGLNWPAEVRIGLVEGMDRFGTPEAVEVMARRAVFDPSPKVRRAALKAQAGKPGFARPVLLAGMRHPWPPAAANAARALGELRDRDSLPALRKMLVLPSPTAPWRGEGGRWMKAELVRVNHLSNCLLCHPPLARQERGTLPGALFVPGRTPPTGKAEHGSVDGAIVFVRQEFSALHHCVGATADWPDPQRFDYLTRIRPLTDEERRAHLVARAEEVSYPQREAARWAIRRLEARRK